MLRIPLSLALVAGLTVAAEAKPLIVKDPLVAIQAVYAALEKDKFDTDVPLSPRLKALMALDTKETGKDEVGRIDFDYFINAQDAKVTKSAVTIRDVDNAPNRRIVVVRFMNFDKQMENHFFWEKTRTDWVLDDVRAISDDGGYVLSLVLKYGWDGTEAEFGKGK